MARDCALAGNMLYVRYVPFLHGLSYFLTFLSMFVQSDTSHTHCEGYFNFISKGLMKTVYIG